MGPAGADALALLARRALRPAELQDAGAFAEGLFADYGLLALLAVFVLEGAMLLYFAPSESLVPAAVLLLADSTPDYAVVVGVAVVGATIGQYALFLFARRVGRERLLQSRFLRVSDSRLERFDAWFDRYGPLAVPVANALPFTRGMLTVPAGLGRMSSREFVALSALGTLAFETALAALALGVLELL